MEGGRDGGVEGREGGRDGGVEGRGGEKEEKGREERREGGRNGGVEGMEGRKHKEESLLGTATLTSTAYTLFQCFQVVGGDTRAE